MATLAQDSFLLAPEIFLAVSAMCLLMLGVFGVRARLVMHGALMTLGFVALLVFSWGRGPAMGFGETFMVNGFTEVTKLLILFAAAVSLALSYPFSALSERFEYAVLLLLATLGMMMMVSANDLITLYLAIELQSLSLYILAAFARDSLRSAEAGLKYFILGALSSGILLYGCSLIYGATGVTDFSTLAVALDSDVFSHGLIIGLVFVLAGLAFKASAAPFHMWTPDVYEGAPTCVTAFFISAPKVAAVALLTRVALETFPQGDWQQIVFCLSGASMLLGAFAAIGQSNIKRLLAYASIGHVGYALAGLAVATQSGIEALMVYIIIYVATTVGIFACLLCLHTSEGMREDVNSLSGMSRTHPGLSLMLAILLLSQAGLPPLAGFLGKFYIFYALVDAESYTLALIGVFSSVVSAYYYLRLVKVMFFDEPTTSFEEPFPTVLDLVRLVSSAFALFLILVPAVVTEPAHYAVSFLFE